MKRLGYYILYVGFLILLLYLGSQLFQYLRVLVGRTFEPLPLQLFLGVFPMLVGAYLALPSFISQARGQGRWTIDWAKLVTLGAVSLFLALAPVLIYFPQIGQQALQLLSWLSNYNQGVTIFGVVFGYVLLSVPRKSMEKIR